MSSSRVHCKMNIPDLFRRLILSWIFAAAVEYLLLPAGVRHPEDLETLAQMSFLRVVLITLGMTLLLTGLSRFRNIRQAERWCVPALFIPLAVLALLGGFSLRLLITCLVILGAFLIYAIFGWKDTPEPVAASEKAHPLWAWLTAAAAAVFFLILCAWTVGRVFCLVTPTYDFGIFSQMFYYMKETGLPMTTLERSKLLSHFAVHVSPIWYLLLPVYWLFPHPATLQVMQAAVMASAVIPLWKLGKHHGLTGLQRMLLCAVLLAYPAFAKGSSFDIHENCFLTPLILWLFYAVDRKKPVLTAVSVVLVLMVKEDAAVYVAVIGLWLVVKALLRLGKERRWELIAGAAMVTAAVLWFLAATGYLAAKGDGVMTYRYSNYMYDGSDSLVTVIKAVIMNPMKMVYECVDPEKLGYIAVTLLPLLGLPLITRRYERYILLIPYLLINLMSDYLYQYDISFQYNFGSCAFLMYLTAVNLADLKGHKIRFGVMAVSLLLCCGLFATEVMPSVIRYTSRSYKSYSYYQQVREMLDSIPEDASVTTSTFYTTWLSQREIIYDIYYCSTEQMLQTEYIVLEKGRSEEEEKHFEKLTAYLEEKGYREYRSHADFLFIYHQPDPVKNGKSTLT